MTTDAEIESFIRSFEDGSLPRSGWTHAGHLIVALWYVRRHDRDRATGLIRDGIRRYNEHHGNPTGYHETITLAWVAVIARFLADHDESQPLWRLVVGLLEQCGDKDYLLQFYSNNVLMSDEARRGWVPPDLRPLESPARFSRRP